jgi:hypothetical protein
MEGNEYYTKIHEELSKKYGVDKLSSSNGRFRMWKMPLLIKLLSF